MARLVVLLVLASELLTSVTASIAPLQHGSSELLPRVSLGSGAGVHIAKRQSIQNPQPIRVTPFYQSSVNQNLDAAKSTMIREQIIPNLLDFLAQTLSVQRSTGNILLNHMCSDGQFFPLSNGNIACANECVTTTLCGGAVVLPEHLKQCRQCNGPTTNPNSCPTTSQDGAGVDTDYILYVTADQSKCPAVQGSGPQTVALALACQMEASSDRPVAGTINFCPDGLASQSQVSAFTLVKHEMLHALAFSSSLFPFWRDSNGDARTDRDDDGFPPRSNGAFVSGQSTIRTRTYPDWVTNSQTVSRTVTLLVTPRVVAEGRSHFGCDTLPGVELEDQGGSGTAMSHWEKRILGNEAMTGVLSFNGGFSRITYAALDDSGWYSVNYDTANELVWGRGAGCRFAMGSCREWINTQRPNTNVQTPITPFCDTLGSENRLECTNDRDAVGRCNLATYTGALPTEFQYFENPAEGGGIQIADYCPFVDPINFQQQSGLITGSDCSNTANLPDFNPRLESFGAGSRCVNHGRQWTRNGGQVTFGAGCYQYRCSVDGGVRIGIGENVYQCSCEGEEIVVEVTDGNNRYEGSVICPSCSQICHDDLSTCPSSEQQCYGRVTSNTDALIEGSTLPPPPTGGGNNGGGGGASTHSISLLVMFTALFLAATLGARQHW